MVRVQSGISPSVASALVAAVKSSGALGPWNGAWAFALKVSTASRILHRVVLFAFYFFAVKRAVWRLVTLSRGCSSLRVKWQRGGRASSIMARKYMRRIWDSSAARLR
jgi:hypothetical protein